MFVGSMPLRSALIGLDFRPSCLAAGMRRLAQAPPGNSLVEFMVSLIALAYTRQMEGRSAALQ